MNQIPHARLLPIPQATPARHPRPAPEFLREYLPGNAAAKDDHNAGKARAIRNARPPTQWPSWRHRQERFDKIPQRIWKQRGGYSGSRNLADKDQVSKVLLHALRDHESRRGGLGLKADEAVDGNSRARNATADKSLQQVMSAAIADLQKLGRTR